MLPTVAKYLTRPCEVLPALLTPLFSRTHYTTTKNLLDFSSLRTKVYGAISAVYFGVAIQSFVTTRVLLLCVLYRHNGDSALDPESKYQNDRAPF